MRGGARPGSGRKPKANPGQTQAEPAFDDPLAYLLAVACGQVKPDSLRIAAAKAALPYSHPKARAPKKSPAPEQLRAVNAVEAEKMDRVDWAEKVAKLRRDLG